MMTTFRRIAALVLALLSLVSAVAFACNLHEPHEHRHGDAVRAKIATPLWVGPAFSGSWLTPTRSGEGFILQVLDSGSVLAIWFTFPPQGSTAQQAWVLAQDGVIDGNRVRFGQVFTTRGPHFGAGFDPAAVVIQPWGTLEITFTDCNHGEVTYAGPAQWGSATRPIERLTAIDELGCNGKQRLTASGSRALSGLRQRSAAWFDPTHSGEGWFLEELADGRAVSYWFTYDERGEQAWTIGVAEHSGDRIEIRENLQPLGTHFGADFDPAQIQLRSWGNYTFAFNDCDAGSLSYASSLPAFGNGTLRPQRLSQLAGAVCINGTPRAPTGGTWSAGATMPEPQSEVATAINNGKFYVAGGFGATRGFKRYDPANGSWTTLADVPGSRDHALGTAVAGDIFVAGGFPNGTMGDQANAGWRYVEAENRWEVMPGLPFNAASGAASLNGYAYFGSDVGEVAQFDPGLRRSRVFAGDAISSLRDHSQLVAFMGELWLMGGRNFGSSETGRVSIFDPASETWREGPTLRFARGGFAAATTTTQIIVTGGEVIVGGNFVRTETEAIAAGEIAWSMLPALPVAVHGVGSATLGNAFYTLGGSTLAGSIRNRGNVQIYRWTP